MSAHPTGTMKPGYYKDVAGTIPAVAGDAVALVVTQSYDDILAAQQPVPRQQPDALHLASVELARQQHARIAELESEAVGHQAELAGYEHTIGHLSALVDELRAQQTAQQDPLTTEQVEEIYKGLNVTDRGRFAMVHAFAAAIESAHGIMKGTT